MELDQEQSRNGDIEIFSKTKPGSLEEFKKMIERYNEINQRMQTLDRDIKTIIRALALAYRDVKAQGYRDANIKEAMVKLYKSYVSDYVSKSREYGTLEIEISYLELTIKPYIERKERRAEEIKALARESEENTELVELFAKIMEESNDMPNRGFVKWWGKIEIPW